MKMVFLGLSITSSWGNGHATTYRGLLKALAERGHDLVFLERDVPWYASNCDLKASPEYKVELYRDIEDLKQRFGRTVAEADFVCVGSYVPQGSAVGQWVLSTASGITAFYDIDTPVTLAKLQRGEAEYLTRELIPRYHLYLSFTGGPILQCLEGQFGSPCARTLYCSVDPDLYYPQGTITKWDLGYLGTYSADRQPGLEALMFGPARCWPTGRFIVAGPQYPAKVQWPENVKHIDHLAPPEHGRFYSSQKFTLNLTRADMRQAGYSPSVRLFEAAACGTPIISDVWSGLETIFRPGEEILVASSGEEIVEMICDMPRAKRLRIGDAGRKRVLASHTAAHRARELENYIMQLLH